MQLINIYYFFVFQENLFIGCTITYGTLCLAYILFDAINDYYVSLLKLLQ